MKLISITDFVLETHDKLELIPTQKEAIASLVIIKNYANFLEQPLTLGMFVPCDLEENVLEEPEMYSDYLLSNEEYGNLPHVHCNEWNLECIDYQEAKERCLFEGFRLEGKYMWHEKNLFMISDNIQDSFKGRNTEFLLSCYKAAEIFLTESAKKQIGL